MMTQFFTIGLLMLFSAMLPGPDFALVTKNTLLQSRRAGFFTAFGVGAAVLVHITYCALGLAWVIAKSLWIFNLIKYVGASYLIYLGVRSFFSTQPAHLALSQGIKKRVHLPDHIAFRQGFLCNLLNPKATLFFLSLFTVMLGPETPSAWLWLYAAEMFFIIVMWFSCLTWILSHPRITTLLEKAEKYIAKILGIFLIGFGAVLVFAKRA